MSGSASMGRSSGISKGRIFRRKRKAYKKKPLATKQYVKNVLSKVEEAKYLDSAASTAIDFSGQIDSLSTVPQGTTDITRVGDKLMPKSLEISFKAEVGDTTNVLRIIIFRWHPISTPTPGDILSVVGTAYAPLSPYYHDGRSLFEVIIDKQVPLASYDIFRETRYRLKLAQKTIKFVSGGTTGADKIYILYISDSGAATHPSFTYFARLNYTDS